ncbi:A/G-specific adenine glycosylase [Caldimonas thermodepolymerans]|uniref:Adenine DNA glycosylase n=1 Tax=Caldimonas thermodepolymerans TaxID=215580 RepID=A0A2S5T3I6_9BURK|nr:A/G-specific adenine glycosylase [Caldimonas thermodepolymerans]PPE69516.1 A/G-specific adenine glycosylase [Caldimonas thermodepolymerans]QPC30968.1 A/G-specific adenine glycosylase [Caldimonas thermodepolymerans]RDH97017.1 A/G-specific DNA-adenine glycosylase [Caldimonas thermodepolymerans]
MPTPSPVDAARLPAGFAARVIAWQREHGRHQLPWQRTRDPYRVWLSEIMLQQTQVTTVLGYYERFLARFPDVVALADAPLDEVLSAWSGLGYYSRARNLHRCAQVVRDEHGGRFPASAAELERLPGIGRSTAAAIAAFCFGERAAILDGNVKRVLTRVLGYGHDLAQAKHERELWALAEALLPERDMGPYTQGLMDLGATVCLARSPHCLLCPVQALCAASAAGRPQDYPVKTRKLKRSRRENWWLWAEHEDAVWLMQRPDTGVWAGLYSLPEYPSLEALREAAAPLGAVPVAQPPIEHALTHFDWVLHPVKLQLEDAPRWEGGRWVRYEDLGAYGLPAPLRKLLAQR